MKFELGKCYRHTTGEEMKIVGEMESTLYGNCLVGENDLGKFNSIGKEEWNGENWEEISENDWMKNFS
jgi:hypothetical protein